MPIKPPSLISGLDPAALFGLGAEPAMATTEWQPPTLDETARLFPQWQVRRLLGRGGMGAVYEMHQPELDRVVAVKLLPIEASRDEHLVERFRREARTLAKLRHPGIVALLESGVTSAGHLFFVMEHVDGSPLNQWIAEGRLNVARAIEIVRQVCDALAYAHSQGVIHRDIKPSNILLDSQGRAKVADFGLACWQQAADQSGMTLSRTGAFLGTPAYAAPEQVRNAASVDHRADIYALGVLLYEMLTGDLPRGVFQPPSRKRAGTDARLDQVVQRALQERPEDRYQAASELRDDVTRSQTRVPDRKPEAKSSTRSFFKVAVASFLLVAVAGLVSVSWWGIWRVWPPGSPGPTPGQQASLPAAGRTDGKGGKPGQQSNSSRQQAAAKAIATVPSTGVSSSPVASAAFSTPATSSAPSTSAPLLMPVPASAAAPGAKVHVWSVSPVAPALYPPPSLTTFEWRDAVLTRHGGAALLPDGSVVVWDETTPGKEHRFTLPSSVRELAATPSEVVALARDGDAYLMPRSKEAQPRVLASNVGRLSSSSRSGEMLLSARGGTLCRLSFSDPDGLKSLNAPPMEPVVLALDGSVWGIGNTSMAVLSSGPGGGGFQPQSEVKSSDLAAMGASVLMIASEAGAVHQFNGANGLPDGLSGMTHIVAVDGMALAYSRDLKAVLWGPKVEDSPQRFKLPEGVVYMRLGPTGLMAAW